MQYASAVKFIRSAAIAVSTAHLALIVLDVSVMASSLPYVYVSDPLANCGARFLVHYASGFILESGAMAFIALVVAQLYTGWARARNLGPNEIGTWGQAALTAATFAYGFLAVAFFLSALGQVTTLRNPPPLPKDPKNIQACIALGGR
jgi:hypothetical protein